jgi:predicted metal-dependent phosphoesterase TrpH
MSDPRAESNGVASDVTERVDLHVHSNRSDGRADPAEAMAAAKEKGLLAVALTDHDTLDGVEEAARAAEELSLAFVPGLEFSAYDESGSTHLLGYYVDPGHAELREYLSGALRSRIDRAGRMVEKLNRLGVELTLDEVRAQASGDLIARPHVARALLAGGWVNNYVEAFDRLIADGRPAFVPTQRIEPAEAIRRVHEAGGLAVLAHGGRSHDDAAILQLADSGLDGLEVLHPDHGPVQVERLRRLAHELGLLETGGSDWHGPHDSRRGQLASMPVPYEWYERLRDAAVVAKGA